MKQEVQVILTLEVDITKSKEEIKEYIKNMEYAYTQISSITNRMEFSNINSIEVKEESEIYDTEI